MLGRRVSTLDFTVLDQAATTLALSPDGKTFATVHCSAIPERGYIDSELPPDKTIQIRRFGDGKLVEEIPFKDDLPYYLCYSPEGDRLISATRTGSVSVWNMVDYQLIKRFAGVGKSVRDVALFPKPRGIRVACGWRPPDSKEVDLGKNPLPAVIEGSQRLEIWEGLFD